MKDANLEQLGINVIRGLAMDAPQAANAGHPGTAMALAPLAHVLWTRVMNYDASDPSWPDRDRFILSAGHASILLYSMLYLTGTDLSIEDLKQFRQWGSKTPGHPEVHHTKGVETTTGPLGQGFANGVGMGIAERILRAKFSPEICDHHTFVIAGDGCMQEGISHEAASLAGHLGLGRLIYIYDDNHITIDGPTELSFSDDTAKRFEAYGWDVNRVGEIANEPDALERSLRHAMEVEDKPSLIVLRSHIGWPSPTYTDTDFAHGNPLGEEEVARTKEILGIPPHESFYVPEEVLEMYREAGLRGKEKRVAWKQRFDSYKGNREELDACYEGRGLDGWQEKLPTWEPGTKMATRVAIKDCFNATIDVIPGLVSGGADLTGNTGTKLDGKRRQSAEFPDGRQIYFGVREHGMGGVMVGMAHHGGVIPSGGTFFAFADYMRGAVRLAAMSEAHCIFVWTHDSIGIGEDGPTHQPIEQIASLRAMPQLSLIRPADANETAHAYRLAIESTKTVGLLLTRQAVPVLEGTADAFEGVAKGAYVLHEASTGTPDVILLGVGSEVSVCIAAADLLAEKNVSARVVSMPSWDLFEKAGKAYQDQVLPTGTPVLSVEAGSSFGWDRWSDAHVAIDRYGASASGAVVLEKFGFNPQNVAEHAIQLLGETK